MNKNDNLYEISMSLAKPRSSLNDIAFTRLKLPYFKIGKV
jgi:hypothetical protein